ncbi:neuropeptide FF receptor 2-like [Actinia tenebrosa]|uniref:Neuropeptide FF receptor 2-like n=1 Tax=Actinia tenebrosa TaxID=6105 RepID=A0A6P8IL10_ACTTE|nr:neuropeptide FF receptor 2-like [Actinia tenebrosa]XP_031567350.1 neuropeptide FF receptor 2-like [Actinia tenebrosa]
MLSPTDIAIMSFFIFLIVVDIVGNILLVYIIISTPKQQRQVRDIIVLNMSVADIMVGVFFFPRHVLRHAFTYPYGVTGDWLCKFVTGGNFSWVGSTASSFSVIVLAFERYFAVIYPFKQRFTLKKVKMTVIVCWLYAVIFMSPLFFVVVYSKAGNSCIEHWTKESEASAFSTLTLIFLLIIPVALMAFLYGRVIRKLWFGKSQSTVRPAQHSVIKSRKTVTKMLLIVTVVYIICWSSDLIIYMLLASSWNSKDPKYSLPEALVLLNSAVNPIIFIVYSQRFRKQLMRILGLRRNDVSTLEGDQCHSTRKITNQPPEEMRVETLSSHAF